MRRRTGTVLSSLLPLTILAAFVIPSASPAAAQETPDSPVVDLTCTISGSAQMNPGVGLLPQPQTLTGEVRAGTEVSPATPCTSLTGVPYQGFTATLTGTGQMACTTGAIAGDVSGTGTFTWDNSDVSTVEWSVNSIVFVPVVNVTITDGPLTGATVVVAALPIGLTGNCILNPVTEMGFAGVTEILGL